MVDWENWKIGALIGLVYGLIGLGYFLFVYFSDELPSIYLIYVFSPLILLAIITPVKSELIQFAFVPVYGAILGTVISSFFGWLKKRQKK